MALRIELTPPGVAPRPGIREARNLRLLAPWAPDDVAPEGDGRTWADSPAPWMRDWRLPASVSEVEPPARPSAMLVMRLLLDAWRSAERQLGATVEGSLERSQVQAQVATLRSLYQGLFVRVRSAQTRVGSGGW